MFKVVLALATLMGLTSMANANPMKPDSYQAPSVATVIASKPKPPPVPTLLNVVVMGDYRSASFVGGSSAEVGDMVSGYKLVEVNATHVIFERNNTQIRADIQDSGVFSLTPVTEE